MTKIRRGQHRPRRFVWGAPGLPDYFPDNDLHVLESLWRHDLGRGELEFADVSIRRGLAIGHDAFAFHVDYPVLADAISGVETQLVALVEGQRAVGYLDEEQDVRRFRDPSAVIVSS